MINNTIVLRTKKKAPLYERLRDFVPLVDNCNTKVKNPVTLVEKVLISKLKLGDRFAFSNIFSAYYKDLVLFATRFTYDLCSAEEIVQDTFLKLWEKHETIEVDISLKSYLLRIVQNKCIDWCRHKKVLQMYNNCILESPQYFEYDTDSYVLCSELQKLIENALGKLPESISEAYRLNRDKGLKYHEIAALQNVSVRTIEVRIGKALNILRNHLKDYLVFIIGLLLQLF